MLFYKSEINFFQRIYFLSLIDLRFSASLIAYTSMLASLINYPSSLNSSRKFIKWWTSFGYVLAGIVFWFPLSSCISVRLSFEIYFGDY